MSRRIPRASAAVALALVLLVAPACSDDGREDQAGNVTAPPVTLETTTTQDPGSGEAGSLAGTAWLLDRIVEPDGTEVDTTEGPVPAIVSFTEQGIDVYDGVNTVGGEYSQEGDEVLLELGTPSQFPYPDQLPQYGLIPGLGQLDRVAVDGARMQVTLDDGTALHFEQAATQTTG